MLARRRTKTVSYLGSPRRFGRLRGRSRRTSVGGWKRRLHRLGRRILGLGPKERLLSLFRFPSLPHPGGGRFQKRLRLRQVRAIRTNGFPSSRYRGRSVGLRRICLSLGTPTIAGQRSRQVLARLRTRQQVSGIVLLAPRKYLVLLLESQFLQLREHRQGYQTEPHQVEGCLGCTTNHLRGQLYLAAEL